MFLYRTVKFGGKLVGDLDNGWKIVNSDATTTWGSVVLGDLNHDQGGWGNFLAGNEVVKAGGGYLNALIGGYINVGSGNGNVVTGSSCGYGNNVNYNGVFGEAHYLEDGASWNIVAGGGGHILTGNMNAVFGYWNSINGNGNIVGGRNHNFTGNYAAIFGYDIRTDDFIAGTAPKLVLGSEGVENIIELYENGSIRFPMGVNKVYADNAAAVAAGLKVGEVFRSADGVMRIVF